MYLRDGYEKGAIKMMLVEKPWAKSFCRGLDAGAPESKES